eukprot:7884154-Alexandrium_andersonii.AAC.1
MGSVSWPLVSGRKNVRVASGSCRQQFRSAYLAKSSRKHVALHLGSGNTCAPQLLIGGCKQRHVLAECAQSVSLCFPAGCSH